MMIWVHLFTEKVHTLLQATMGKKSKVNKCPKMLTDDKYWKLTSEIAIVLGVKFSQKCSLFFFVSADSFYPTQYFRRALYYQTTGASDIINGFPSG